MSAKEAASGAIQGAGTGAMIGGPMGALIGGIGGGVLGLFGGGDSAETEALAAQKQAYDQLKYLSPEERTAQLAYLENVGALTPEMVQSFQQNDTELNNIQLDPQYKQAQLNTLQRLQQIGSEGLTATDMAAVNEINNRAAQQNQSMQGAVLQNQAARGMLGSGDELAARLSASQAANETANQQGTNIAAQQQARALQGIMQAGTLAGQMGNTDYSRAQNAANAQDIINKFNTQSQQSAANTNTATKNDAAKYNLDYQKQLAANKQAVNNQQQAGNVKGRLDYQTDLNDNTLGRAGAAVKQAKSQDADSQAGAQGVNDTISGVGGAINAIKKTKTDGTSLFGNLLG